MVLKQGKLFDNRSIDDRFKEFMEKHPAAYELFKRFAWQLRHAGRRRFSADAIIQRIRWECWIGEMEEEDFKFNDHFTSRFARKLIAEDSSFEGFFETRKLKSD